MSTTTRTTSSDAHTRRRRHAGPADPSRVRRAGVVGGVVSTLALGAMAPSASAGSASASPDAARADQQGGAALLTPGVSAEQAADALGQTAMDLELQAAQDEAAAAAKEAARKTKAAEEKRKAAARKAADKAARERAEAAGAASRSAARTTLSAGPVTPVTPPSTPSSGIAGVIDFLRAQVGKPYVYGATGPSAYDCSGLTQAAFRTIGVELPRTSQAQSTFGTPVSLDALQVGDLVFWGGVGSAYHVAVYIGSGQYLDAANPGKGVVIQKMSYYMPTSAVRVV